MMPFVIWMLLWPFMASLQIKDNKVSTEIHERLTGVVFWMWLIIGMLMFLAGLK